MRCGHLIALAASAALSMASASAQTSTPRAFKEVPCAIYGSDARSQCAAPFLDGVVDDQWIGLLFNYTGTNGGATAIEVFSIGYGGNGELTKVVGKIVPETTDGDRMFAVFGGGKLWVGNAIYLPGEAHCCFTHKTVRQFGFHDGKLRTEATVTVPASADTAAIAAALAKAPHLF